MNHLSAALLLLAATTEAFVVQQPSSTIHKNNNPQQQAAPLTVCQMAEFNTAGMWNAGNSFGKGQFVYYKSLKSWMSPFPEEDKAAFPEIFSLPKGLYEVTLESPLGIVFEEIVRIKTNWPKKKNEMRKNMKKKKETKSHKNIKPIN